MKTKNSCKQIEIKCKTPVLAYFIVPLLLLSYVAMIYLGLQYIQMYKTYQHETRNTQSTTSQQSSLPTDIKHKANPGNTTDPKNWKTFTESNDLFSIKYPTDWEAVVREPTIATDETYFGTIALTGPEGSIDIVFGDGFGGGSCDMGGGTLDTFVIDGQEVKLCHVQLDDSTQSWVSNCGDCSSVRLSTSDATGYVFKANFKTSYEEARNLFADILGTFGEPV